MSLGQLGATTCTVRRDLNAQLFRYFALNRRPGQVKLGQVILVQPPSYLRREIRDKICRTRLCGSEIAGTSTDIDQLDFRQN